LLTDDDISYADATGCAAASAKRVSSKKKIASDGDCGQQQSKPTIEVWKMIYKHRQGLYYQ
jgi:hypothetical protein